MKERIGWIVLCVWMCGAIVQARPAWSRFLAKPDEWFRGEEGKQIIENILTWQDKHGAWPKNVDTTETSFTGSREKMAGTFDNGATTNEIRMLARAFRATGETRYRQAFIKGLDLILTAQYPTGGWPQFYPPSKQYHRHITFNDGTMVLLMELLDEIAEAPEYEFVDAERREKARKAFDRGIACILKCQIKVNGKLTVWCAQHDELDYSPRPGRSYELVSLSGGESGGILRLLMRLDDPSAEVIDSITAGVAWYESSQVKGIRVRLEDDLLKAVEDPAAPPLWARFYDIQTNRPLFSDRDGVAKYDYNQLGQERGTGYKWLGDWGDEVFQAYAEWTDRWQERLTGKVSVRMVIVGDSTVCDWPAEDVRRGWGQFVHEYLTDTVRVANHARSGRSTKTFIREGLWTKALADKPAYVLIQFGHNDSHDPGRPESTDAETDYADFLRRYVDETRAAGAIPVLITPMVRRTFDSEGRLTDSLLPYAAAMKRVAAEKKVALVDLHTASGELFGRLGPQHAPEMANAPDDRTHFNEKGARAMAELVMTQLFSAEPSLKPFQKNGSEKQKTDEVP